MGSSVSAVMDDYDEYVEYCKKHGEQYEGDPYLYGTYFYRHWDKLKKKYSGWDPLTKEH